MGPSKLTEYERRRLENIRRNDEMMKALNIRSKASELSESSKRQRVGITKSYKVSPEKKPKPENTVVIRRSLRTRGIAPDSKGLDADFVDPSEKNLRERVYVSPLKFERNFVDFTGPINMRNAYVGDGSDQALTSTLLSLEKVPQRVVSKHEEFGEFEDVKVEKSDVVLQDNVKIEIKVESEDLNDGNNANSVEMSGVEDIKGSASLAVARDLKSGVQKCVFSDVKSETEKKEPESCVDLWSMSLKEENIARVVPGRIMLAKFLPSNNVTMIAVGNKYGNVGFWNVDGEKEEQNGIYLYRPHSGPLSGILFQQSCLSKMYTSCYDGYLRLMDVEKEVFDLLYTSDEAIFALSQRPSDDKNLYFAEGYGSLSVYDDKMGKFAHEWSLHAGRINSIDFSSQNTNLMATSSTDGTACIWDLRKINAKKPESLREVKHQRAVHSAYFSPSAKFLATTSFDDKIGITTGANFEETSMIFHNNQTNRWISSFKSIWGWDDSYVFVGNMKRGVDVISPFEGRIVHTLESPFMTAIPCRFDAHPYKIGMVAGGTGGGQIYIWTSSCIYL